MTEMCRYISGTVQARGATKASVGRLVAFNVRAVIKNVGKGVELGR